MLNSNTNVLMLRRCRRTGGHNTGVCTRLINFNVDDSTCRVASPPRGNTNTTLTVTGTLHSTNVRTDRVNCIGTRNASAPTNSGTRTRTIGAVFNRTTDHILMDSAGSVANRLLNTTNTMRSVCSVLTLHSRTIPPAVGLSGPSRNYSLSFMPRRTHRIDKVRCALYGSFNFNNAGNSLVFGGVWIIVFRPCGESTYKPFFLTFLPAYSMIGVLPRWRFSSGRPMYSWLAIVDEGH